MSDRIHRIRAALAEGLDTDDIAIRDDSHLHVGHAGAKTGLGHFHVTIRSPKFTGVSPIERHRLVYEALGDLMQTDIHARADTRTGARRISPRPDHRAPLGKARARAGRKHVNSRVIATGCLLVAAAPLHARTSPADTPVAAARRHRERADPRTRTDPGRTRSGSARICCPTPAAVDVVGHDAIDQGRRKTQLNPALNRVPGVYANNGSNFAQNLRVSIRGFGARSAFGVRGVRVLVDGIPETLVDGQAQTDSIDLGAIDRMEVLRGPFSALYGNATGGVIDITTLAPGDGPLDEAEVAGGSNGYHRESLSSAHKYDKWGYAATVSRLEQKGYRQHSKVVKNQFTGKIERDVGDRRQAAHSLRACCTRQTRRTPAA